MEAPGTSRKHSKPLECEPVDLGVKRPTAASKDAVWSQTISKRKGKQLPVLIQVEAEDVTHPNQFELLNEEIISSGELTSQSDAT